MAEAPKPQRTRRRRRVAGPGNAAPTADTTTSGVSTSTPPRPRRRRRRTRVPRPATHIVEELVQVRPRLRGRRFTRAIKRELRREGLEGPKVSVQQQITSTFGLVRPNTTGNVELELNFFLHPSLAKEANEGTAFGPVQALAAQYSLWKLKYLVVKFTPMVGASAVSGTVVRASLNMSQSPGSSSWSGLGTRIHMDMHPGQATTFRLRADQLGGPRDGGWWFTDTNEEGSQSAGPIVEVHTMGKTESTFQSKAWEGPLFLVEGIGLWQFANYNVKPALGSLERREGEAQVTVKATASQPITLEMTANSTPALFMDSLEPETFATPGGQTVGETIFQIVDVGATLAQNVAPPPFGWLIKGGWWFVKKLLKRTRSETSEYVVYASLQDAQNNKPAIATGTTEQTKYPTTLLVTQMNSPNVGPNPYVTGTPRAGPQTLRPGDKFKVSSEMLTELFIKFARNGKTVNVPVSAIPGVLRQKGTGTIVDVSSGSSNLNNVGFIQTPWWIGIPGKAPGGVLIAESGANPTDYLPNDEKGGYIHTLYRLHDPRFTNQSGVFEYLEPEPTDDAIEFCALVPFSVDGAVSRTRMYEPYGKVVGTSRIWSGTDPALDMVLTLIKITKTLDFGSADSIKNMVLAIGDTANKVKFAVAPPNLSEQSTAYWTVSERDVPPGAYLLGVSYTNTVGDARGVDIPTWLLLQAYSRVENTSASIFPYNLSGQMLPATSIDAQLQYVEYHPPSQELIDQLKSLKVSFSLPPHAHEVSEYLGPSGDGEGVEEMCVPCVLPPIPEKDEEDDNCDVDHDSDSGDSLENFLFEIGNEMIEMPRRWLRHPEFSKFLDM